MSNQRERLTCFSSPVFLKKKVYMQELDNVQAETVHYFPIFIMMYSSSISLEVSHRWHGSLSTTVHYTVLYCSYKFRTRALI